MCENIDFNVEQLLAKLAAKDKELREVAAAKDKKIRELRELVAAKDKEIKVLKEKLKDAEEAADRARYEEWASERKFCVGRSCRHELAFFYL